MKRLTINIFLLFVLMIFPYETKALECSDEQKYETQKLAYNVAYSYTYNEKDDKATFDITFTNLHNRLSIMDNSNNKVYSSSEVVIKGLEPNREYSYDIYSAGFACSSSSLRKINIKTPGYNKFYKDKICNGIEDFKYCQKWANIDIAYEELKREVSRYKLSLIKQQNVEEETSQIGKVVNIIINIYTKYYYLILPTIIVLAIVFMIRDDKKSQLK